MHTQEQMQLLIDNPIVQELLDILENEGKAVLNHLDQSYIDRLFDRTKSAQGRPRVYPPSPNLKPLLYGLAEGRTPSVRSFTPSAPRWRSPSSASAEG